MDKIEFGKRVKSMRKKKQMTQIQLAQMIGKKETTIRKYENGSIEAPWNVIEEIADALDVSPFDLTVDIEQLRTDIKLQENIQKAYGAEALSLLNEYDSLNQIGKQKACEYVSDLTEISKYKAENH